MKALPKELYEQMQDSFDNDCWALLLEMSKSHLNEHSDCEILWIYLGIAYTELYRFKEAEEALQRALSMCDPNRLWLPLHRLGKLHTKQGHLERAAYWFQKAVESDPDNASGYIFLAEPLVRLSKLDKAKELYQRATECSKGAVDEAFLLLGGVLLCQGKYQKAKDCFVRSLEIDPQYELAKLRLTDVEAVLKFLGKSNEDI